MYFSEDFGEAPVPPLNPEITTLAAPALTTPFAIVPTFASDANLTLIRADGFVVCKS